MKHKVLFIAILGCLLAQGAFAQSFKNAKRKLNDPFGGSQWYVGFRSGASLIRPIVAERYSEFSAINSETAFADKEYQSGSDNVGYHAGISLSYAKGPFLYITLSAVYNNMQYAYDQSYSWIDPENEQNTLLLDYEHRQSLYYLELPLTVRYAFPMGKFKPYALTGITYGRLLNAQKHVVVSGTDYASGGGVAFENAQQTSDVSASYIKSHAAALLGGGIQYNFGSVLATFDASYRYGLHNITRAEQRYAATRHLAGLGNVPDNIRFQGVECTVSLLFPLKFLTDRHFKPVTF